MAVSWTKDSSFGPFIDEIMLLEHFVQFNLYVRHSIECVGIRAWERGRPWNTLNNSSSRQNRGKGSPVTEEERNRKWCQHYLHPVKSSVAKIDGK
jgi:hypothetical protein